MDFFTGSNDAGTLGLGLAIAAAVAGLFAGTLGRGAGLILVPALYHVLSQMGVSDALRFNLAAGTSLACLVPLSLYAAGASRQALDKAEIKATAPLLVLGLVLGTACALFFPARSRVIFFGLLAFAVIALTLWQKNTAAAAIPKKRLLYYLAQAAAAQGMMGSLLGITGVALPLSNEATPPPKNVHALAWLFAIPVTVLGTLTAAISGWNIAGLPEYSYGFVNLKAFGIVAPVLCATAALSARYAGGIEAKSPKAAFALIMAITTGKMLWDA